MKKPLKIIAWTLIAVVVVAMGLALAAGFFAPGMIRDFVVKQTGFGISYDKFAINPFAGIVEIENLKLTNPSSFNTKDFVALDKAIVSIDLFSLASPTIHFREVTLHLSSFDMVRNSHGVLNTEVFANAFKNKETTPAAQPSPSQTKPTAQAATANQKELSIDKLSIVLGTLRSTDETRTPARVKTNDINFSIERTNIRSMTELQANLTAAILPAVLNAAGIDIAPLSKITGSALGTTKTGISTTTQAVDAVAEKAASRLQNFLKKHE
jgi:uncharacterized protein involved in outer membrane biogenesis